MASIWGALQQGADDATLEALEEAGRAPGQPYEKSHPLPLSEVEWALTVNESEFATNETWPPARFSARQQRLQLYHDLWRGDLRRLIDTRLLDDNSVGVVNVFRRLSRFVADLLVRERPTAGQEDGPLSDGPLARLTHKYICHALRSGAGYLFTSSLGGQPWLRVIDARYAYPMDTGGWIIVEPRITRMSNDGRPDALQAIIIRDGVARLTVQRATPTGVGDQFSVGPVTGLAEIGPTALLPAIAPPEEAEDVIGTSWFDDLITVVVQQARRMAGNTRALDRNSDPLLLMRGDLDAYTRLPGVPRSAAIETLNDPSRIQRQAAVAQRLRHIGPLVLPSGIEDAEYVTWDGEMDGAFKMLDEIARQFRFLSGLPAALDSDAEIPSGMSLRRMFWQFDASVAPIYHEAHAGLSTALRTYGATLEWENAFEAIEDTPMANEREDVGNEAQARRGEG